MRHRCVLIAMIIGLAWSARTGWSAGPAGQWPTARQNPARTGHSDGRCSIRQPAVRWRVAVSPVRSWVALTAGAPTEPIALGDPTPVNADYWPAAAPDWHGDQRRVDMAGDGKTAVVTERTNLRYGRFLPGAKGLQKLYFEDGMSLKNRPNGPKRPLARGMLYRYDKGEETLVWQTEPEPQAEIPLCALGDMDGDGRDDLAVSTWWRVMVFDVATGAKKMECRWHKGRNYGHFQLANLDDDPYPECIVLADFMIHLNVLDNDGKALSLAWRKEVEFKLFGKRKVLRIADEAVTRGPGGRKGIVVNLFNDGGDQRWHVTAFEPLTGKTVADLPDRYLHGVVDLDGDGTDELLLSSSSGPAIPRVGPLFIGQMTGEGVRCVHLSDEGAWLKVTAPMRPDRATCAAEGRRTVAVTDLDADGTWEAWFVGRAAGMQGQTVSCVTWSKGVVGSGPQRCSLPEGAIVDVLAVREKTGSRPAGLLLQIDDAAREGPAVQAATLRVDYASATLRSRRRAEASPDVPVVARLSPDRPPTIVVPTGLRDLVAFQVPKGNVAPPKMLFRCPGMAQTTDASGHRGVEAADVNGDGRLEILAAEWTDKGQSALAARDVAGRCVWRRVFDRFAAGPTMWNTSGILMWTTGRFLAADRTDVLVTLRRSVMHTDETYLLDGRTGKTVWHQDDAHARGWGGQPFAIGDCTGDGLDDVVCQYPDVHFVASGRTGELIHWVSWPHAQLGGWSAYGYPILIKPSGLDRLAVLTGNCRYTVALWSLAGKLIWHTPFLDGSTACPAVADFDGDGQVELIAPAYRGGLRLQDLATGTVDGSLPTPNGQASDVAAADVDGDGRPDAVFSTGSAVWAVAVKDGKLTRIWECPLDSQGYAPIIADCDGDGICEILVLTRHGELVCIGPRS